MIIVMQCANTKHHDAGYLLDTKGQPVRFVGNPAAAPHDDFVYARPDDLSDNGQQTWREVVLEYNQNTDCRLSRAVDMYRNKVYSCMAEHVGIDNFYIFSAGWGIVPASFRLPLYDITFSGKTSDYQHRSGGFNDWLLIPEDPNGPIVFLGGNAYRKKFLELTSGIAAQKIVFYRIEPDKMGGSHEVDGVLMVPYATRRRTCWYYDCAADIIYKRLRVPDAAIVA